MPAILEPEPLAKNLPVDKVKAFVEDQLRQKGNSIPNKYTKLRPGALQAHFERYSQRMGQGAKDKKQIMEAASMSAQDFAQMGSGKRSISYRRVHALAMLLGCHPWNLLADDDPHREVMMHPLKIETMLDKQERERKAKAAMRTEMANFNVPLKRVDDGFGPLNLVDAISTPGLLELRIHPVPPPGKDYGLDPAYDIDKLFEAIDYKAKHPEEGRRAQAAKELHILVQTIEGFGLYVLSGRYVERYTNSVIPHEDLENGDVHLRKVLVVKVSAQPEEPGFVVDRSQEPQIESIDEIHCDSGSAPEWQEARRWESCY